MVLQKIQDKYLLAIENQCLSHSFYLISKVVFKQIKFLANFLDQVQKITNLIKKSLQQEYTLQDYKKHVLPDTMNPELSKVN